MDPRREVLRQIESRYLTARVVGYLLVILGMVVAICAAPVLALNVLSWRQANTDVERASAILNCGIVGGFFAGGILQMAAAQVMLAIVDTAINTAKLVTLALGRSFVHSPGHGEGAA